MGCDVKKDCHCVTGDVCLSDRTVDLCWLIVRPVFAHPAHADIKLRSADRLDDRP